MRILIGEKRTHIQEITSHFSCIHNTNIVDTKGPYGAI